MSILTEEEIDALGLSAATKADVQDIEAAILAKLAGMELPEPFGCGYLVKWSKGDTPATYETGFAQIHGVDTYTADQLRQAYAQGAASQLSAEPSAWMIESETQHGEKNTYPLTGRYKDVCDACDFGEPVPLYTLKTIE